VAVMEKLKDFLKRHSTVFAGIFIIIFIGTGWVQCSRVETNDDTKPLESKTNIVSSEGKNNTRDEAVKDIDKKNIPQKGGLLDLSMDDLYSEMLNQVWVNEKTGDTIYIETSGISATDGSVYENGVYTGDYSAYGVYGSEAPNGIISEGTFQLEIWRDAQPDSSYLYEVEAIGPEELEFYDTVTGVFGQYARADENVNVPVENQSGQATSQEMTLEEAREYLIQCMYEVHPDFDAREDFAYSLQNEDEYCYSFQVLVKNAQTTSNNMGFYSVFKNSGEVYDDIFGELIWTPYDGLIN